eukprot:13022292-Alexandrium_andersonii.AAC.1
MRIRHPSPHAGGGDTSFRCPNHWHEPNLPARISPLQELQEVREAGLDAGPTPVDTGTARLARRGDHQGGG